MDRKVVFLFLTLITLPINSQQIQTLIQENNALSLCVADVVQKYYANHLNTLTYVSIGSHNDDILKAISSLYTMTVFTKKQNVKSRRYHQAYVISAENTEYFIEKFDYLSKERFWNPRRLFMVIIDNIIGKDLKDIFNVFLKLHVSNVIVVNGTDTTEVYAYDPFQNNGCGRYFERVIKFGSCLKSPVKNFFPKYREIVYAEKEAKNMFRNCTLRAVVPHFPPFTIDPKLLKYKSIGQPLTGVEQYVFGILGKLYNFDIEYIYKDVGEKVAIVDDNMTASFQLKLIQNNEADLTFGGIMLNQARANAFDYLYSHLAMVDCFMIVVRRAGLVSIWKTIYLEFSSTVWILFVLSFISCTGFVMFLIRKKDRVSIILQMWDNLFTHGYQYHYHSGTVIKFVMIMWVWFSYLINSFYQSSLVSLTTNPSHEYQVQNPQDLIEFNFESCVSDVFREYLNFVADDKFSNDTHKCKRIFDSIKVISETDGVFTILPISLIILHGYEFYDSRGNFKLFLFSNPVSLIMYSTYFYKGFPLINNWELVMLRLRESGLVERYVRILYYEEEILHRGEIDKSFRVRFIFPWYVLVVGLSIAFVVFLIEKFAKKISVRFHNRLQTM